MSSSVNRTRLAGMVILWTIVSLVYLYHINPWSFSEPEYNVIYNMENTASESKPDLLFIHIPKNAGSTVMDIGKDLYSQNWSIYRKYPAIISAKDSKYLYLFNICSIHPWHIPPKYWTHHNDIYFRNYNINDSSKQYETFCVIRDPLSRILSHYKWRFSFQDTEQSKELGIRPLFYYNNYNLITDTFNMDICDKYVFNLWITDTWNLIMNEQYFDPFLCHLLPQYEYIFDDEGMRTCDHVLNIRYLNQHLTHLIQTYIDPLFVWNEKYTKNSVKDQLCQHLTVNEISFQNKKLLNQYYENDYKYVLEDYRV